MADEVKHRTVDGLLIKVMAVKLCMQKNSS